LDFFDQPAENPLACAIVCRSNDDAVNELLMTSADTRAATPAPTSPITRDGEREEARPPALGTRRPG